MHPLLIPSGWLLHIVLCFYVVRPLRQPVLRILLTLIPCAILTLLGCHNLPYFLMSTIMLISLYWMIIIRLFHLIVLSSDLVISFRTYCYKFLWFFIPIESCTSKTPIVLHFALFVIKIFLSHWAFKWLSICEPNDSYSRVIIIYVSICSGTAINELQIVLVRLLTFNRYSVLEFSDYPFLAKSVREFWGRRYNRLVSILLKESIFDPIRQSKYSSSAAGAFASFIVSGILHAHIAMAGFGALSPFPAFSFFVLHGIAAFLETKFSFKLPKTIGIVLTQSFLLITAPLYVGLFSTTPLESYQHNKPLLFDVAWLPKLPVPAFCPK